MSEVTPSALRADLYRLLDRVLETGEPIEVRRRGGTVVIAPQRPRSRLEGLRAHPGAVTGDPEDLVSLDWSSEWRPGP